MLAENLEGHTNSRLGYFGRLNNTSSLISSSESTNYSSRGDTTAKSLPDYLPLVNEVIKLKDIELQFLALNHNRRHNANWRTKQDLYAKKWFYTALKLKSPSVFQLLLTFNVDLNQGYDFNFFNIPQPYWKRKFTSLSVNILMLAIVGSASDVILEGIAIMCINHGAQNLVSSEYQDDDKLIHDKATYLTHAPSKSLITALYLAAFLDNATVVQKLIDKGADWNSPAFAYATSHDPEDARYRRIHVSIPLHTFRDIAELRKSQRVLQFLAPNYETLTRTGENVAK